MKNKTLFLLLGAGILVRRRRSSGGSLGGRAEKVGAMAGLIQAEYFRTAEADKMARAAVRGMLETLDPHSYLLDPDNLARMSEEQRGPISAWESRFRSTWTSSS